jgi:hypothetical protein
MCAFGPRTSPTTRSSAPSSRASQSASTTRGNPECCNDISLHRDRRPLDKLREPCANRREHFEGDAEHVAGAEHPRNVGNVGEPVLGTAEPRTLRERGVELAELGVEPLRRAVLTATQRVVRPREVVVPEDPQSRKRAICCVGCEKRRLGIPVLEELHDHRGLRQQPPVLLQHGYAACRVLLVDPRGTIGEVDLDRLVLDRFVGEHDAHARAVRAARSVVEREHQTCTPISSAIC